MPQAPWNYPHAFDTMPPSHVPPTHGSVAHLQNLSALNALSNTFPPMPAAAPPALRPSSLHPPPSALTGVGLGSLPAATAPTYGAMMGAVPQAAALPPASKPPKVVTNTSELLECMQADEEQQKASEEAKGGVRPSAGMLAPRLSATSYRPDDLRSLNRLASHPPLGPYAAFDHMSHAAFDHMSALGLKRLRDDFTSPLSGTPLLNPPMGFTNSLTTMDNSQDASALSKRARPKQPVPQPLAHSFGMPFSASMQQLLSSGGMTLPEGSTQLNEEEMFSMFAEQLNELDAV